MPASARSGLVLPRPGSIHDRIRALSPDLWCPMQESSGNLSDVIGGLTGTANGSLTYQTKGPPGLYGIGFDGSSGYFDFGNVFNFTANAAYTLLVLAHTRSIVAGNRLVSKIGATGWDFLVQTPTNGTLQATRIESGGTKTVGAGNALRLDLWRSYMSHYDGSVIGITVDGEARESAASAGTQAGTAQTLKLGRQSNAASNYWPGSMAGFAIWSRCLSSAERAWIGSPLR